MEYFQDLIVDINITHKKIKFIGHFMTMIFLNY